MAEPLCPYFGRCGGCSSQHIDYDIQLENKRKVVQSSTGVGDVEVIHGEPYHYRNRMDMIFHPGGIGFREKGKWNRIVDIERCVISNDRLNVLIAEVRENFKGVDSLDLVKKSGTFCYAVIRTPRGDSSISFVLSKRSTRLKEAIEKVRDFAARSTADNIVVTYADPQWDMSVSDDYFVVKGSDMLKEEFMGKTFFYSVQAFFQNNPVMAEKMLKYTNDLLFEDEAAKEATLIDLYGGVGTFGIVNSSLFRKVEIVESVKMAIDAANKNIEHNGIKNASAHVLEARQIGKLNLKGPVYVITDPPRTGMDQKTIQAVRDIMPKKMIYISCNVQQMGKDIAKFREYDIKRVAMFDLFPQTPHVEAIVELVPKPSIF